MNRLERDYSSRRKSSASSRGQSRSSDRSKSSPATRGSGASRGGAGSRGRGSQSYRSGSYDRPRSGSHKRKQGPDYKMIAIIGVILIVLIACIVFLVQATKNGDGADASEESVTETAIEQPVTVDGVVITGMNREEAKAAILEQYPWSMTIAYGEETYEVTDLMAGKVDLLLNEIYAGEPKENYSLDTSGLEEAVAAEAAAAAAKWNKSPVNGSIQSYDKESGKFVFAGEEMGFAIDQEKLAADIQSALEERRFDAVIEATGSEVQPEITEASAKELYKTISTFTTTTTANSNRNTNVRLAAEAINGTVIPPGGEFSFNGTVGQRTEAKGYKSAAAYSGGEVVQETGGGVCQVSSTLYNAVVRAGMEISYRRSHTFEPSYVTPGQDATVSWEQPDFKFINTSKAAIGLKASYADRKMTVSVYGIPVLEEGVTIDLESVQTETLDPPAPTYEEDQTLQLTEEKVKSAGSNGSRWVTYKITYKDGVEVSREQDHTTTYKGHAPVILRNTSGVVLTPEETTTGTETAVSTVDGMPEDYVPGETTAAGPGGTGEIGPGIPTTGDGGAGTTTAPAAPDPSAATTQAAGPGGPGAAESSSAQSVIEPISPHPGT